MARCLIYNCICRLLQKPHHLTFSNAYEFHIYIALKDAVMYVAHCTLGEWFESFQMEHTHTHSEFM